MICFRVKFSNLNLISFTATLDGGLGYVLPLPEKIYRRLYMLQNVLQTYSAHLCGLNPKSFRTIKQKKMLVNPSRSILDGELIYQFFNLNFTEKTEVAKKIGTKVEEIYYDLFEIDTITRIF